MNARTIVVLLALIAAAGGSAAQSDFGPGGLFALAERCMACHNGLVAPDGLDVSIGGNWRASMMAHSSRDPYWQAAVRRETIDHPSAVAVIEDECAVCHMPMSRFLAAGDGRRGEIFAHLPLAAARSPTARLAGAGVSCTVCHQVRADGLGEPDSFTGGFVIDRATPLGGRDIFGPFDVDEGRTAVMRSASRFEPARADHVQSSELCATCHTLYTHALGPDGEVVGELPEQVPYLEWRHSDFSGRRSCQSCHMPEVAGEMAITGVLGQPRAAFSRHVFRGGNFLMPRIFNRFADELEPRALPEELDTASRRTAEHLQTSSAEVRIAAAGLAGDRLELSVELVNLAGHKLPTAYPSRRAWLHLEVADRDGRPVFSSGALRPDGAVAGNDNDADPRRFEPHHEVISKPEEVQVYEAVMVDPDGRVTTGLLSAVRFVKDNRLLPSGFDPATADPDIAVQGGAAADPDFSGGSDRVRYRVEVDPGVAPFRVTAKLWYQPVGFRWARNLADYDADEPRRFVRMFDALSASSAVVLAGAEATVTANPSVEGQE
ncbi:MAG TPA: hypothetical protein VLB51_02295 [Methylomirabilota bacterium]|nr:hypothetical protein [Methylomirabilota bacterium]